MPKLTVNVHGMQIVLTSEDGRVKLSSALAPGEAFQLASMLFASVADAAANLAFHQAANAACPDCQVKIARARQVMAEEGQKRMRPRANASPDIPPVPPVSGANPIEEK